MKRKRDHDRKKKIARDQLFETLMRTLPFPTELNHMIWQYAYTWLFSSIDPFICSHCTSWPHITNEKRHIIPQSWFYSTRETLSMESFQNLTVLHVMIYKMVTNKCSVAQGFRFITLFELRRRPAAAERKLQELCSFLIFVGTILPEVRILELMMMYCFLLKRKDSSQSQRLLASDALWSGSGFPHLIESFLSLSKSASDDEEEVLEVWKLCADLHFHANLSQQTKEWTSLFVYSETFIRIRNLAQSCYRQAIQDYESFSEIHLPSCL